MPRTWCRHLRPETVQWRLELPLARALIRGIRLQYNNSVTYVKSGSVFLKLHNTTQPTHARIIPEVLLKEVKPSYSKAYVSTPVTVF